MAKWVQEEGIVPGARERRIWPLLPRLCDAEPQPLTRGRDDPDEHVRVAEHAGRFPTDRALG